MSAATGSTAKAKAKQFAFRNLRLCTKDCLCLYVCPTGASDTEDSIIDITKCIGCGTCARACVSGAISIVPVDYPKQQEHTDGMVAKMKEVSASKATQEATARTLAEQAERDGKDGLARLMRAVERSSRLMEEDIFREAGYMLPQSANTRAKLDELVADPPTSDFPVQTARDLLDMLRFNE